MTQKVVGQRPVQPRGKQKNGVTLVYPQRANSGLSSGGGHKPLSRMNSCPGVTGRTCNRASAPMAESIKQPRHGSDEQDTVDKSFGTFVALSVKVGRVHGNSPLGIVVFSEVNADF